MSDQTIKTGSYNILELSCLNAHNVIDTLGRQRVCFSPAL